MGTTLEDHPEILPYLDPSADMANTARIETRNGSYYLIVNQVSEFESDRVVFRREGASFRPARCVGGRHRFRPGGRSSRWMIAGWRRGP